MSETMRARRLREPAALPLTLRLVGVGNVSRVWWLRHGLPRPSLAVCGHRGVMLRDPRRTRATPHAPATPAPSLNP